MFNPSALDIQYGLTSLSDVALCVREFMCSVDITTLASRSIADEIINNISKSDDVVNSQLFTMYNSTLSHAVDLVFSDSPDEILPVRLRASLAEFAAFKAKSATDMVRNAVDIDEAKAALNTHNRYLAAEYNTARTRARSARQFNDWNDAGNKDLFPNIKWLPSRSVKLRDDHVRFYNRVWAKTDSFWNSNQPGALWNCKCDWQQTDEPVTDGNPGGLNPLPGLNGNPANGTIFSDDSNYYPNEKNFDNEVKRQEDISKLKLKMENCYYNYKGVNISAFADKKDLPTNINICKILNNSNKVNDASIRPHTRIENKKNAELLIDKHIGDVKAIETNNVKAAFRAAIEQDADVIVIPTINIPKFNLKEFCNNIGNRYMDFQNNVITKCLVIHDNKVYLITKEMFKNNIKKTDAQSIVRNVMGLK